MSEERRFITYVFTGLARHYLLNDPWDDDQAADLARQALEKTKGSFTLSQYEAQGLAWRARKEFNEQRVGQFRKGTSKMEASLVLLALLEEVEEADWTGPGGPNNKKVVIAVLDKALDLQNTKFSAGDREMAARAGLSEKPYQRARNRVNAGGYWFKYEGAPAKWIRNKQGVNVRKPGAYRIAERKVDFGGRGDPRDWEQMEVDRYWHQNLGQPYPEAVGTEA